METRVATVMDEAISPGRLGWRHSDGRPVVRSLLSAQAFATLTETGTLTGDPGPDQDEDFRAAYDWMRRQMATRIPGYGGHYPVWAWARITRAGLIYWLRGSRGILVTFTVEPGQMVLSDEMLYHFVLNGWPLPPADLTEEQTDRFDAQWDARRAERKGTPWWQWPTGARAELEATWERIILDFPSGTSYLQACLSEVRAEDILDAVVLPATRPLRW